MGQVKKGYHNVRHKIAHAGDMENCKIDHILIVQ